MKAPLLFVPGPVNISDQSLALLGTAPTLHYGKEWANTYHETINKFKKIIGCDAARVFLLPSVGTLGIDTVFHNVLKNKDKALILSNGFFGECLATQAKRTGADVSILRFPWHKQIELDATEKKIRSAKYQMVAVVHHETSSGIINPIREISLLAQRYGCLTMVDAVSSAGGVPIEFDNWKIDFLVTVSNKCLESIHGVAPVAISSEGMLAVKNPKNKIWYLDFLNWDRFDRMRHNEFPHPSTMPTNAIRLLNFSLEGILNSDLTSHYNRYQIASNHIRETIRRLGLLTMVDENYLGPLLTSIRLESPEDQNLISFMKKHGIIIGGGLGKYKGKCVRVANMGLVSKKKYVDLFRSVLTKYFS